MTFEYGNVTYNGTPCLHKRDTYRTGYGTGAGFIQVNDWYFDADEKWIADEFNVSLITARSGTTAPSTAAMIRITNTSSSFHTAIRSLREGPKPSRSAIRPTSVTSIICPNQNINGRGEMSKTYWFNASIPVPVKVQPLQENVVFELVDWG